MRRRPKSGPAWAWIAASAGLAVQGIGGAATVQDFDTEGQGTPWAVMSIGPPPPCPPALSPGGPAAHGRYLRVAHGRRIAAGCPFADPPAGADVNANSVAFDLSDAGAWSDIVADFDLRLTPANGRADGFGFALLDTDVFGSSGPVGGPVFPFAAEEPNFAGSLGLGFDIFDNTDFGDLDDNHVSIHFDGDRLEPQVSASDLFDLGGGEWFHVRVHLHAETGASTVTVQVTPCGGEPRILVDRFPVPGLEPYEARAYFAARSGGLTADLDLDNVRVTFLDGPPDLLSLATSAFHAVEGAASAEVTIRREPGGGGGVTVDVATEALTATAGTDFVLTEETVTFAAGETLQTVSVPLLDDALVEAGERFRVTLASPGGGASLGGPSTATVTIADDETARFQGLWSPVQCWPAVPIHVHLLPTGQVLFWGRVGEGELPPAQAQGAPPFDQIRLWDPASNALAVPALPPHDVFCSGHSLLADGRLLVTGGNVSDNVGLPHAVAYDAERDVWEPFPDMNDGRWYPTNVTLADGNVAVESGDIMPGLVNTLPQVLDVVERRWRDLTAAELERPPIADLYPRLLLAPDGRLFKAGPDQDSWYLETAGAGDWIPGPFSSHPAPRTYGPAVAFDTEVLLVGGGDPPTKRVDRIDLAAAVPLWQSTGDLEFPRRHHNATLLPDGSVLVTGGTSSPGFNDSAAAVRFAEIWDPASGAWTLLAPMNTTRIYHSAAVLLPDARVLVAGGGQPNAEGDFDHRDAEIFSPPYLFRGPRPTIIAATPAADHGQPIMVDTPDAASIARVSLLRPGSATHAFDQGQRLVTADFAVVPGGLEVTPPSSPSELPPGPYMLFLIDDQGIPSDAAFVRIGPAIFLDGFETGDVARWSAVVP